jgi:hypothetical protein
MFFSFESGNGIQREEKGFLKNPTSKNPAQVMSGSWSQSHQPFFLLRQSHSGKLVQSFCSEKPLQPTLMFGAVVLDREPL